MPDEVMKPEAKPIANVDAPILDDPDTVRMLESGGELSAPEDDIKEPAAWEKPMQEVAEGQKSILEVISQLTQAVAAQQGHREVVERVVEREPAAPQAPTKRKWEEKLKPEAAEVLKEAFTDMVREHMGKFQEEELTPAFKYLIGNQESLIEDQLARKYDDDTFGYAALRDTVQQFRRESGGTRNLESAYREVAFTNMMEAVLGSRDQKNQHARLQKRSIPVDDGSHGTPPGSVDPEDVMDEAEKRSAFLFFGRDDKTGKQRSQKEIEALWMENKRGAKKDMMVD